MNRYIRGVNSIEKTLKGLPKVAQDEIKEHFENGGERLAGYMRQAVPKVSGDLRDTIRVEKDHTRYSIGVRIKAGGPNAVYARIVEFAYGRSFFFGSWYAFRPRIRSQITRRLRKTITTHTQKTSRQNSS